MKYRTWGSNRAVRLPGPNTGPGAVAVTVVVNGRRPLLISPRDISGALDVDLAMVSPDGHVKVLIACFMPDHIHLMLMLDGKGSPLGQYIRQWKTKWTKRLRGGDEKPLWQRSFYDHWMRKDEAQAYAAYIVANPMRKGLVESWQAYPYTRVNMPL